MPGDAPTLSKTELFARLAQGHAAAITVVTPNRRLAQVLKSEFDAHQAGRNLAVWEDADILPLDAFVARRYEDALYADGGGELPVLLSEAQSRELWEAAIAGSKWAGALLDVPQTAARAMDAWRLAHAWRIAAMLEKSGGGEDARAFAEWAKAYARRLKKDGLTDAALLPGLEVETRKPQVLVAYAFDIVPAQARDLFERFGTLFCSPAKRDSRVRKISFSSPGEEIEAAARWARAKLEAGAPRIGVVVPDLELRRREVVRVFARVMGSAAPFNLSIGEPLSAYPMVAFALSLLEFTAGEIEFERVSRVLRSPFLGGAEKEMAARARLDAKLRDRADVAISLPKLIGMMGEGLDLRSRLEEIFTLKAEGQSPHDWARHFTAVLEAAGFPGERALDSAEFQVRAKFNEVLGEFSRLSLVSAVFSPQKAIRQLQRLCSETLFQPERGSAPVQVLGLLESAGVEFDALWVSGLTDDQWPLRARPNPFLPLALQRKAGIPEASADSALALDRRITADWTTAAPEVVFSWARREEDRDLLPSPLIADIPEGSPDVPSFASWREMIFKSAKTETFADEKAPALAGKTASGGTRVLSDQAACPFRAYAHHRLRAQALQAPEPGPDAMDRGLLVHALMAGIWKELKTQERLQGDVAQVVARAAQAAVRELNIESPFAELEVERLKRLAMDWLALERARPPFEVIAVEKEAAYKVGGLTLKGRIDRMDRFLEGEMRGSHALIDYKTGAQLTPRMWMGERPDEPQLPFYAVSADAEVSAVAFGRFRSGQMRFMGYARDKEALPQLTHYPTWTELLQAWKASLARLADDFAAGDARVDPKRGLATCRNCDLQTLCRVHERLDALGADEEGE